MKKFLTSALTVAFITAMSVSAHAALDLTAAQTSLTTDIGTVVAAVTAIAAAAIGIPVAIKGFRYLKSAL